jgi:hypothetical protein
VAECAKGGRQKHPDTVMHRFPTSNPTICKVWISKCKRDFVNHINARICSNHFNEDDYERDLEHELFGLPPRKKLKKTAVPSIFEDRKKNETSGSSHRQQRMDRRASKSIAQDVLGISFEFELFLHIQP